MNKNVKPMLPSDLKKFINFLNRNTDPSETEYRQYLVRAGIHWAVDDHKISNEVAEYLSNKYLDHNYIPWSMREYTDDNPDDK